MKTEAESHFAIVQEDRTAYAETFERFDRIAFAMRALSILKPERLRVAVYSRMRDLHIERGRDFSARGERGGIALVGIPPNASRHTIAMVLANLAGAENTPFLVDLLVLAGSAETS